MRVRWIGTGLALVLVGAAAGYGVGVLRREQPVTFAQATPVPASSPSYPVIPVVVLPDPDLPSLEPGLPLHQVTVGTPPFTFRLPIPKGWIRTNPTAGSWHWHAPPDFIQDTYFIRVTQLAVGSPTIDRSLNDRLAALDGAADVSDLHVESRSADSFVANYVSGGHRHVDMERFVADDNGTTFASIGIIGREQDRRGMEDLFARIPPRAEVGPFG